MLGVLPMWVHEIAREDTEQCAIFGVAARAWASLRGCAQGACKVNSSPACACTGRIRKTTVRPPRLDKAVHANDSGDDKEKS